MKIGLINIRGLTTNKLLELQEIGKQDQIDIFPVTENHIKKKNNIHITDEKGKDIGNGRQEHRKIGEGLVSLLMKKM